MGLVDKISSAARGLALSAALAVSGCGFSVGRDAFFTGGIVGGGVEIVHRVYEDDAHTDLSAIYDIKVDVFAKNVSMKVSGEHGERKWGYRSYLAADGKDSLGQDKYRVDRTEIFDAKEQKVNEFSGVPRNFPTGVQVDNVSGARYTNARDATVRVEILNEKETVDFYVRDRKKPNPSEVITGE